MAFDLVTGLIGPGGPVAVKASKVVLVIRSADGCELRLEGGSSIPLKGDAGAIAQKLWGYPNEIPNGFFNSDHVQSVTPHPNGARIILTDNSTIDMPMSPEDLIRSITNMEGFRRELDTKGSTLGKL